MLEQCAALALSMVLGSTGLSAVDAVVDRPPARAVSAHSWGAEQPAASVETRSESGLERWAPPRSAPRGELEQRRLDEPHLAQLVIDGPSRLLLRELSGRDSSAIHELLLTEPSPVRVLLQRPPAASVIANWWQRLDDDRHELLHRLAPELVGNLDGVPLVDRDRANRLHLRQTIVALELELSELGRGLAYQATDRLHMLTEVLRSLETTADSAERRLLALDVAGSGRAAVVIGNLDAAEYVSLLIPGMFFTVDGQMVDWADIAQNIHDDQQAVLATLGGTPSSVATVAWLGYHTPHLFTIASLDQAEEGAGYLTRALNGLRVTRGDDDPYLTLIAHSYGSTAAMLALQQHTGSPGLSDAAVNSLGVDALAMIGSPGGTVANVAELGIEPSAVFVGQASGDPIASSGFYGRSPADPAYGARPLAVNGGVDPLTGSPLPGAFSHLDYFSPGSQAMRSIALVALGLGNLTSPTDHAVAGDRPVAESVFSRSSTSDTD